MNKNVFLTFEQISYLEELCLRKISIYGIMLDNHGALSDSSKRYLEYKKNLYSGILKSLKADKL